jgi:hypothetical protein
MAKGKKQGHGGYMQSIKGHVEVRGKRKPYLELRIQITPENCKKLVSQMRKLTK